jgi:pimeloyl-ACP methyl ester carboxylesterase
MYYETHGAEDHPPVVLLHGATETFAVSWRKQVDVLARRYRVLGVDLRGHGRSDNPAGKLDLRQMADDVAALLDVLEIDTAHVCGFSGGASTSLFLARRHPQRLRSATLISNNFARDEARQAAGFWDPDRITARDPLWLKAMDEWHGVAPEQLLAWWKEEDRLRPAFSVEELATIDVPTLVVAGDRDPVVPLEQSLALYQALPRARLLVLPGIGHGAPHRAPELLNAALDAFWTRIESDRPLEATPAPS